MSGKPQTQKPESGRNEKRRTAPAGRPSTDTQPSVFAKDTIATGDRAGANERRCLKKGLDIRTPAFDPLRTFANARAPLLSPEAATQVRPGRLEFASVVMLRFWRDEMTPGYLELLPNVPALGV